LPGEKAEYDAVLAEKRTCFYTFYPFKIFPEKQLRAIEFDNITLLYGGNGSGKSTLINLIASKIYASRFSEFNSAPLFERYVDMCSAEFYRRPKACCVLTSDDVFDYVLNARSVNERIEDKRNALFDKYAETKNEYIRDPDITRLKGIDDYERWAETREILSAKRSQSSYIKNRVARDITLYSNGETALRYFIDRIDGHDLYLLDEPENSLSPKLQLELARFLEDSVRFYGCQLIISTHSPFLLALKGAKIYDLDASPAEVRRWSELENVRAYYDLFDKRRKEFE
jgi:predicted ATPase